MKKLHRIETPRGVLEQRRSKDGTFTAQLTWNKGFGQQRSSDFNEGQEFVDSETIRRMAPFTPLDSSFLAKSPNLLTVLGSGTITQATPYARRWYYTPANFSGAPMRGNHWFERMKNQGGKEAILRGLQKLMARKG